jgi:hypothetical protein
VVAVAINGDNRSNCGFGGNSVQYSIEGLNKGTKWHP